jgi:hypothetical protein
MKKKSFRIVRDNGNAPLPVSTVSADEQTRFLNLAEIALEQKHEEAFVPAGSRARQDHEALKQELLDTLEQLQRENKYAA